jgi:predicted GIY-YIG superfamily endonuclease
MNQALYRWFDSEGTLLYVGVSGSIHKRVKQHEKTAEWINQAAFMTVQWFATRNDVESAERYAIENEGPLHNKTFATFGKDPLQITPPNSEYQIKHYKRMSEFYKIQDDRQQLLESRYKQEVDYWRESFFAKQPERIFVA